MAFNMNKIKLANKQDIPEGKSIIVQGPDGMEIALFNLEGNIYGLENVCPHQGGPVGEGDIEEGVVTCPWHGWQFDITTGASQNMPGEFAKKIDLIIEGDEIFI